MSDDFHCHGCGYPVHTSLSAACPWCRSNADEITRLRGEVERLTGVLAYMRDDKSLTKPGYFRRVAALVLRGETNPAWTSPALGSDTPSDRETGDA